MKIEQSQQGTISVFVPHGAIIDDDREKLSEAISKSIDDGRAKIILDMSNVPFVESQGLEMLLDSTDSASLYGGGIRIMNPSDIVRDILTATRMTSKIEIHNDMLEARRSLL